MDLEARAKTLVEELLPRLPRHPDLAVVPVGHLSLVCEHELMGIRLQVLLGVFETRLHVLLVEERLPTGRVASVVDVVEASTQGVDGYVDTLLLNQEQELCEVQATIGTGKRLNLVEGEACALLGLDRAWTGLQVAVRAEFGDVLLDSAMCDTIACRSNTLRGVVCVTDHKGPFFHCMHSARHRER